MSTAFLPTTLYCHRSTLRDSFAHGTPLSLRGLEFTDAERCTEQSDSIGDSTAAVVMVSIFDHVGGEERAVGDLGAGGASISASPKSHFILVA
jgi:hypothetical protein